MPNGNPDFDLNQMERFFEPISSTITQFARDHNLKLQKYYHEGESWDLLFRHPKNGSAQIQILKSGDNIYLGLSWWQDDYDSAIRSIKWSKRALIQREPQILKTELSAALKDIISWNAKDLDQKYSGNKNWQTTWTREEFERQAHEYPIPK